MQAIAPAPMKISPHPTDELSLTIKTEGHSEGLYIITGVDYSHCDVDKNLVVYNEIVPGTPTAIGLLKIVTISPNSLTAQAILVHPNYEIRSGQRVDHHIEYLSRSELVPLGDYATGYVVGERNVRLRPHSDVREGTELEALRLVEIAGTQVDALPFAPPVRLQVVQVGESGVVAEVEITQGEWPPIGTVVKQGKKSFEKQRAGNPGFRLDSYIVAGIVFGALTLIFFVGLVLAALLGHEVPCGSRFLVLVVFALGAAPATSLLGGWAAAEGHIPIPFTANNSIRVRFGGALAVFAIILLIGYWIYLRPSCPVISDTSSTVAVSFAMTSPLPIFRRL